MQCRLERPEEAGQPEITALSTTLFNNQDLDNEINAWVLLALIILISLGVLHHFISTITARCTCQGRTSPQETTTAAEAAMALQMRPIEEENKPPRPARQRDLE